MIAYDPAAVAERDKVDGALVVSGPSRDAEQVDSVAISPRLAVTSGAPVRQEGGK